MTEEQTSAPVDILNKMFMVPRDLAELTDPQSMSFMPVTAGWYWLFSILTIAVIVLGFRHYYRKRRDLWRREALSLLQDLEVAGEVQNLPVLIKRVLLVHVPRAELSQASGSAWLKQVNRINSQLGINQEHIDFVNGPTQHLADVAYRVNHDIPDNELTALYSIVRQWIKELPHV